MTTTAEQTAAATPVNLDAEEYVLSAMMMSGVAITLVEPVLDAGDFYRESHTKIYRAALSLHQLGVPVDGITVAERLEELGQLEEIGGRPRIHDLVGHAPATANVLHHARIIVREARRRHYILVGENLARRARESGDPDELHAYMQQAVDDTGRTEQPAARIATLDQFISTDEERAEAAIGDTTNTLLPAGGLLIIGGEGGASKTTLTLDAIAHIASGTPWLGYPVNRPVRVLIIENEGPRPQFRDKLRDKVDTWNGAPWRNNVHVWEDPWATFSFARDHDRRQLRDTALEHHIDLVVADPLDSLGVVGAGTPEDTRTFITWLRDCGLHNPDRPLAFWLLHHFNKAGRGSIIAQLSGAWGGHPDAILGVELGDNHTTKLTWGKLRHATPPANRTIVLAWNLDTRGFTVIDKPDAPQESDEVDRDVIDYVEDHPGESQTGVIDALITRERPRAFLRRTVERLLATQQLTLGPGRARNGKYLYTASTLSLPLADTPNGKHGKQDFTSERNACRPEVETDQPENGSATGPGGACRAAALPEGEAAGKQTERSTPPHPDADLDALFGGGES